MSWKELTLCAAIFAGTFGHAAEQAFGRCLRAGCSLFAMHHFGQFKGKNFFGTVQLLPLPGVHFIDLL